MSVAGPIRKADLSTPKAREKDHQGFCETLDLIDLVRGCILCPPGLDFIKVCSCHECASKITMLHHFEIDIKSKQKLITDYYIQAQAKEGLCESLFEAAQWTKLMLDLLHKALKAVSGSENSEVLSALKKSQSAAKLGVVYENMTEMMVANDFFDIPEVMPDDDYDSYSYDVLNEIDSGFFYYGKIKARDEVLALLQELEKLEKDHVNVKKTAEAQGKVLDPSISRSCIESQIEVVKKFPVMELQVGAEKLIAEFSPRDVHSKMFHKARKDISSTCAAMILKRKAFWRGFTSSGSTGSNEHSLNGLSKTLDLLIAKANLFKSQWEEEYAPFFTPHDRSNPKSNGLNSGNQPLLLKLGLQVDPL